MKTQEPQSAYTKHQRKLIYLKAIEEIDKKMNSNMMFVCHIISTIIGDKGTWINENVNEVNFPELFLFNEESEGSAWLSSPYDDDVNEEGNFINDYHTNPVLVNNFKITVLLLCIKMCN